jgi:prepilin-type N-terminal cleavage/methylation domain-containing protein
VSRRRDAGFTLLELMFVVAIVAILAGVAMPSFFQTSRKAKAMSEVGTMFNDIRVRLDQFYLENGLYPTSQSESSTYPAAPSAAKQSLLPLPADWVGTIPNQNISVRLSGDTDVYCAYAWITGLPADGSNIGPIAAAAPFNFTAPATNWYYLFAHCDMDGDTSVDSYYFSSSVDTKIIILNEGS